VTDCAPKRFERWQLAGLLNAYPNLRIIPSTGDETNIGGSLAFVRDAPPYGVIEDEYDIEIVIPRAFPSRLPSVHETQGRITRAYHKLTDGSLCLGSPTRLRLIAIESQSVLRYVELCVIPYLYGYSYFERNGAPPFGELRHGTAGLCDDLAALFGVDDEPAARAMLRLAAMRKRQANKRACPCDSRRRLGRCHHRRVNAIRSRLSRIWLRTVYDSLGPTPPV
jgi:hypothetical protein